MDLNLEITLSIASAIIALSALGLSLWQATSTTRHNRLSMTPHLTIHVNYDNELVVMSVYLESTGIGPAILKRCTVKIDGEELKERPINWISIIEGVNFSGRIEGLTLGEEEFIQPNNSKLLLRFESFDKKFERDKMIEIFDRLNIKIDYESVYGDKKHTRISGFKNLCRNPQSSLEKPIQLII